MTSRRLREIPLGTLPRKPVVWRWRNWIPEAFLVLVEGEEEAGKGYYLAWCLVQAASGAWGPPSPGLYLSSEEEPEMLQDRLLAAGYKPETHARIYTLQVTDNPGEDNESETLIKLPEDLKALTEYVLERGIKTVAVDLLRDHSAPAAELGIRQRSNNDETWIRPSARAWAKLAYITGATVLGSHHRNKSEQGSARSKSTGSGGWRQVTRVVHVLAHVGEQRAVALDKNNLCKYEKTPWEYEIEEVSEDAGRFTLGDALTAYRSIDHWEAEMKKGPTLEIDPAAQLEQWCLEEMNGEGEFRLPTRELLEGHTGMSRRKLQQAVLDLKGRGKIETRRLEKRALGLSPDWFIRSPTS